MNLPHFHLFLSRKNSGEYWPGKTHWGERMCRSGVTRKEIAAHHLSWMRTSLEAVESARATPVQRVTLHGTNLSGSNSSDLPCRKGPRGDLSRGRGWRQWVTMGVVVVVQKPGRAAPRFLRVPKRMKEKCFLLWLQDFSRKSFPAPCEHPTGGSPVDCRHAQRPHCQIQSPLDSVAGTLVC